MSAVAKAAIERLQDTRPQPVAAKSVQVFRPA